MVKAANFQFVNEMKFIGQFCPLVEKQTLLTLFSKSFNSVDTLQFSGSPTIQWIQCYDAFGIKYGPALVLSTFTCVSTVRQQLVLQVVLMSQHNDL